MDTVKTVRWVSRLLALVMVLGLLFVFKIMLAQFEALAHEQGSQGAEGRQARGGATAPEPDASKREGDVPEDAVW